MADPTGQYINEIQGLDSISEYNLENIFKVYKKDQLFYFNLGKKVDIPFDIDERLFSTITYNEQLLTTLSNKYYGTPSLWWLILYTNGIYNPFQMPMNGQSIKILSPSAVRYILDKVQLEISETN